MKREEAMKLTESAIEGLATALEQGESEALRKYLETMARFHRYSFYNSLLIHWQRPDATHVAGFHAWKKLERSVRKGEKGIAILAPMVSRRTQAESTEEEATGGLAVLRGFRAVHVFDVSQTDGKPLASLRSIAGTPGEYLERMKELIAQRGIEVAHEYLFGGALGRSEGGVIRVRPGLEPAEEFAVLAHELAHELLHKDAVSRPHCKIIRETEAEAVAHVVCTGIGMQSCEGASDYIRLWQGDRNLLLASLERIRRAAAVILEALDETENRRTEPVLGAAA